MWTWKFCLLAWVKYIFVTITYVTHICYKEINNLNRNCVCTVLHCLHCVVLFLKYVILWKFLENILENFCWNIHFNKVVCLKVYYKSYFISRVYFLSTRKRNWIQLPKNSCFWRINLGWCPWELWNYESTVKHNVPKSPAL